MASFDDPSFPFTIPSVVDIVPEEEQETSTTVPPPPAQRSQPLPESKAALMSALQLTPLEAASVSNIPQGTSAWLDVRKFRLTASNFGAAIGHNKYKSPRGLLRDMLWNKFKGNAATRWGTMHETTARDMYIAAMQRGVRNGESPYTSVRVEEKGLQIHPKLPWLGSSPDGVVHVSTPGGHTHQFLLEIKCPFKKSFYSPTVPSYYNCQIQGMMAIMGLPYCDFVVWVPGRMQVTRVQFDAHFWETTLLPGLTNFYFNLYVPALLAKAKGLLPCGEVEVPLLLT